jgi:hypothetical protein
MLVNVEKMRRTIPKSKRISSVIRTNKRVHVCKNFEKTK